LIPPSNFTYHRHCRRQIRTARYLLTSPAHPPMLIPRMIPKVPLLKSTLSSEPPIRSEHSIHNGAMVAIRARPAPAAASQSLMLWRSNYQPGHPAAGGWMGAQPTQALPYYGRESSSVFVRRRDGIAVSTPGMTRGLHLTARLSRRRHTLIPARSRTLTTQTVATITI
jgi:hypothetical protein